MGIHTILEMYLKIIKVDWGQKLYNKIKIPIKLTYGDNDWANENNKNNTKDTLGLASYNIIKDCGHFSFLESQKKLQKSLIVNTK